MRRQIADAGRVSRFRVSVWGKHKCYAAFLYDDLEEYEYEITRLTRLLLSTRDDYIALNNRGMLYLETGQDQKGFEDLKKSCDLSTTDPMPHTNLGRYYLDEKSTGLAIESYKRAVEIDPQNSSAHVSIADVLLSQRLYNEALHHYTMAISSRDDFPYFYAQRAKASDGLKNKENAKLDREKAHKLDPRRFRKTLWVFRF